MQEFPFPDRIGSREELKRDVLYRKIPESDRLRICDMAWERGAGEAARILEAHPDQSIRQIAEAAGMQVVFAEEDKVNGNRRTFGEYSPNEQQMVLYLGAIRKWAECYELTEEEAAELVMAHEFYHYMEHTKIGLTSELYQVPTWKIGKWVLVKSGIRALSEIGAHGFSRTYIEQRWRRRAWNS